jgi:hypothetical protein
MIEGLSSEIEFIWTDGMPRFAAFRNTDVSNPGTPFQSTTDPNWIVRYRDTGAESEVEWLPYIANDGRLWQAKLHCSFYQAGPPIGGYISTWFEHKMYPNEEDEHDEGFMFFLDWDNHPWEARLVSVERPFPAQPQFILRRF